MRSYHNLIYLICKTLIYTLTLNYLAQNQTEDSIRKELIALQEDKHNYETTAKESLRRVLQEKIEVVRKLSEVEVPWFCIAPPGSAAAVPPAAARIPVLFPVGFISPVGQHLDS